MNKTISGVYGFLLFMNVAFGNEAGRVMDVEVYGGT